MQTKIKCFTDRCYAQKKSNDEDYAVLAQHIYDSFLMKYEIELKYDSFGRNAYRFENKKQGILFYVEVGDRVIICDNKRMVKRIEKILKW